MRKRNEVAAMLQYKAYKLRIYPNEEQEILIVKTFGCARFVYNYFLTLWNEEYLKTGKGLSHPACSAMLPKMKNEEATCWLKEVDSVALQTSLDNLVDDFSSFLRKQSQFPKFKCKKDVVQSYTTENVNHSIAFLESHLKLPTLGLVSYEKIQESKGCIVNATIRRNAIKEFFVSILCEEDIRGLPESGFAIETDIGIIDSAILSDCRKVDNHQITTKTEKKLKREQRKLSKRALVAEDNGKDLSEAKNYQKLRLKVARLQKKVRNQRNDFLNKASKEISKNQDVLCIKD